jgi:hypothetical protein
MTALHLIKDFAVVVVFAIFVRTYRIVRRDPKPPRPRDES